MFPVTRVTYKSIKSKTGVARAARFAKLTTRERLNLRISRGERPFLEAEDSVQSLRRNASRLDRAIAEKDCSAVEEAPRLRQNIGKALSRKHSVLVQVKFDFSFARFHTVRNFGSCRLASSISELGRVYTRFRPENLASQASHSPLAGIWLKYSAYLVKPKTVPHTNLRRT